MRPAFGRKVALAVTTAPVVYGALMAASGLSVFEILDPSLSEALYWPVVVAKLATVVSVPLTLWRFGRAVGDNPSAADLWWKLGMFWAVSGAVLLLVVVPFGEQIARATEDGGAALRVWPGTGMAGEYDFLVANDPGYSVARVVSLELGAVMVLAVVSAICVRVATTRNAAAAMLILPMAVVVTLIFYGTVAPASLVFDYDTFIGDVVLGGLIAELGFFVGPADPIAAVALAFGVSTMAMVASRFERAVEPRALTE